jgi:hypothetical protein
MRGEQNMSATYWYSESDGPWALVYRRSHQFPKRGNVADWCVWNKPLTAEELLMLKNGVRPNKVNKKKLKTWLPLDAMAEINAA